MSPLQALYGYQPPHLVFPILATTTVASVESYLKERDVILQLMKEDLDKAQDRMKFFADKKHLDREFAVGDMVFLKLHPYKQSSVAIRKNLKLSAKYFGPFAVMKRIGLVAYKLQFPIGSKIHPIFHVSQLKKQIGLKAATMPLLPVVDSHGHFVVEPVALLDTRITLRGNQSVPQNFIYRSNSTADDATWEDTTHIKGQFPDFILENKDL